MKELPDSSRLLDDPVGLREAFERDGCLLLRGLLPPDVTLAARRAVLEQFHASRLLAEGPAVDDGILREDPAVFRAAQSPAIFEKVIRLEPLHRLGHRPELLRAMSILLSEPGLKHPALFIRLYPPGAVSPPHQDASSRPGGAANIITVWLPLGECTPDMGPIAYLPGSHRAGLRDAPLLTPSSVLELDAETLPANDQWATAHFHPGDVAIHHTFMVHKSLANQTRDRIRLSIDTRYQPRSEPIAASYTKPVYVRPMDIKWESIYQQWSSNDLAYYWKSPDVKVTSVYDDPHLTRRYQLACEAARRGDARGMAALSVLLMHFEVPSLKADAEAAQRAFLQRQSKPSP